WAQRNTSQLRDTTLGGGSERCAREMRPSCAISDVNQGSEAAMPAAGHLRRVGMMLFQTDRMGDVVELFAADFVQLLASGFQLLVDLNGLLGHLRVGLLAASHQGEVRAGRDALVAVRVQSDTEQEGPGFFLLGNVRHQLRLPSKTRNSRSKARFVSCWLSVVGCQRTTCHLAVRP